jgi:pimeloyl-ACP methyl ester carboxylesterase
MARDQRADLVASYRAMITAIDPEGYAACCEAVAGHDLRAGLAKIQAPTLVIAGEQDLATPPEHGREIVAGIAGARLVVLDPGAHLASVQRAADVTRLIVEHLEEPK